MIITIIRLIIILIMKIRINMLIFRIMLILVLIIHIIMIIIIILICTYTTTTTTTTTTNNNNNNNNDNVSSHWTPNFSADVAPRPITLQLAHKLIKVNRKSLPVFSSEGDITIIVSRRPPLLGDRVFRASSVPGNGRACGSGEAAASWSLRHCTPAACIPGLTGANRRLSLIRRFPS